MSDVFLPHLAPRHRSNSGAFCVFLLLVALSFSLHFSSAFAQESRPLLSVDDDSATTETAANSIIEETQATRSSLAPTSSGRTVLILLGGVSWRDWARLSAASSTSTPFLRRVLEEGGLGAVWLTGAGREYSRPRNPTDFSTENERVSSAMLRAAALLSSGRALPKHNPLPTSLSQTLGISEPLSRDASGYENSSAALAFARRTDRAPRAGNLVNLGWGQWTQLLQSDERESVQELGEVLPAWPLGTLGALAHRAGKKTAAIGNGEIATIVGRGARLREAALIVADDNGVVDGGEVSVSILARDDEAPFGVRANATGYLQALDRAFADSQTALVALEWGDTRRAARYEKLCAPEVGAAHRQVAINRLNSFVGELLKRLNQRGDRLILISVPELDGTQAQLLPAAFWRAARGGQGALLSSSQAETVGLIGLENISAKIAAQLGAGKSPEYSGVAAPIDEVGAPSPSSQRIERLIALGSGLSWLSNARPAAHIFWCALFILASVISLLALHFPTERIRSAARFLWCATMLFPWLLWLAGVCVETTWRFGAGQSGSWKLALALIALAGLMWFLLRATFNWFARARLLGTRIAFAWLLLSVFALWIGAFALPLNGLLQLAPDIGSTLGERIGDVWALLLISATLLGLAELTRVPANRAARMEAEVPLAARRAINLRPALLWALVVVAVLTASGWGANILATVIALLGLGALTLRLWLERAARAHRLRARRAAIGAVVALGVLLLWQRGGAPLVGDALAHWWPAWSATWQQTWWTLAFFATFLLAAGGLLPRPRQILRAYLRDRFSRRAMLGAALLAAIAGVLLIGPAAAPLLATFTLGAVIYEALR
jgi:hypothetical protein